MTLRFRTKRHLISLGYSIGSTGLLVLIAGIIGSQAEDYGMGVGLLLLANHGLIFWLPGYRRAIQRLFLSTERCYNCGLTIDLIGLWGCECGFNMVRHILARCPHCKTYSDHFQCPQCQVSIRV